MPKCILKTVFIAKRKQNEKNGMNNLKRDEKKKKKKIHVRAARKVFPHWSQKQCKFLLSITAKHPVCSVGIL